MLRNRSIRVRLLNWRLLLLLLLEDWGLRWGVRSTIWSRRGCLDDRRGIWLRGIRSWWGMLIRCRVDVRWLCWRVRLFGRVGIRLAGRRVAAVTGLIIHWAIPRLRMSSAIVGVSTGGRSMGRRCAIVGGSGQP